MKAKYVVGNRVRIKPYDFPGRVLEPDLHLYDNMTGEILESTQVVAFMAGTNLGGFDQQVSIYHYTVRINDHVTLSDVLEDSLEIIG